MQQISTTPETAWKPPAAPKPLKPLTRKQAAFVQELINNPKQSATKAALKTYDTTSDVTASNIATENLRKPPIMLELAKHSATAEMTLLKVLQQSEDRMYDDERRGVDWAGTARQTANDILNRVHGTPTSRHEVTSTTVTLSLSLKDITASQQGDSTPS